MTKIKEIIPFSAMDFIITHIRYTFICIKNNDKQDTIIANIKYLKQLLNRYID